MTNTREENAAELAREEAIPVIPITRAELIEKLMDDAEAGGFDYSDDYASVLRYGMNGFENYTNKELEEQAIDWCLLDDDGNEVRYTITDADTSKPSEEKNTQIVKDIVSLLDGTEWDAETASNIANVLRDAGYLIRDSKEA